MATRKSSKTPAKSSRSATAAATTGASTATAQSSPSFEEIQRRAYELYLARGGSHGDHLADWFAAQRELAIAPARKRRPT